MDFSVGATNIYIYVYIGKINQVLERAEMTWVLPRVLDLSQVKFINHVSINNTILVVP